MSEAKLRIGLDLDGVVVNWHKRVLELLYRRGYNFDVTFESPYWDWIKDQVKPADWGWLWTEAMEESYATAEPYHGAVEFARKLRFLGDVIILTSRPEGSWTTTIEWWRKWMKYTPAGYNFFRNGKDKPAVWCQAYIEDNVDYAKELWYHNPGSRVLLFSRPWNSEYDGSDGELVRVASYEEALKEIENCG